jgi:hypothetical protein
LVQVGAEDLQMAERLQVLEVGVLGHVIWGSDLIKRGLNNYPYSSHSVIFLAIIILSNST